MTDTLPTVSILIAALDEAGTIGQVLQSIPEALASAVLVVDGGSTDGTVEIARSLGFPVMRQDGRGLGDALATGVRATQGDIIVTLDADGAHDGRHVLQLLDKVRQGYDLVIASRMPQAPDHVGMFSRELQSSEAPGVVRDSGNRLFTAMCRTFFGLKVRDVLNGCKAFRREVFLTTRPRRSGQAHDIEFLLKAHRAGFRIADVSIDQAPRLAGASKLSPLRDGCSILGVILTELTRVPLSTR